MAQHSPELIWSGDDLSESAFWATQYVPAFLHDGGYTKLYRIMVMEQQRKLEKEKLDFEKLKYDVKSSKRIYKSYWWTFFISILGFILALGKIIYDIFK